jgi:hypothetical protein
MHFHTTPHDLFLISLQAIKKHHRNYLLIQKVPEMIKFLTIHAGICNNVYMFKKQDKYNMTTVTTKETIYFL